MTVQASPVLVNKPSQASFKVIVTPHIKTSSSLAKGVEDQLV